MGMGLDFTASNTDFSLEGIAQRNRAFIESVRDGSMVDQDPPERQEEPQEAPSTSVSTTSAPDSGASRTPSRETLGKPRRGRPRGPARKMHSITFPDAIWEEMCDAAVDNDTNVSAMLEELWVKKGRRTYGRK